MSINRPFLKAAFAILPYAGLMVLSIAFFSLAHYDGYSIARCTDEAAQILPGLTLLENQLLSGGGFWNWNYGLGGDVVSELAYYYSLSPTFYFDLLIKYILGFAGGNLAQQVQANLFISAIHQTLIMWAMYAFLRSEKLNRSFSFIGATIYGMSIWIIWFSCAFSFMVPAALWLPILVWAFNRYRRSGKWVALSASIGLTVANNFYFGYQTCLFLITLFFCFSYRKGEKPSTYLMHLAKLAGITIIGLLLSAVSFLVACDALVAADRTPVPIQVSLWPNWDTLSRIPELLFMGSLDDCLISIPAFCILFLLIRWKDLAGDDRKRTLLTIFWLICLFIPFTGNIMNGFSASLTRWHFIVQFMLAWSIPHWLQLYSDNKPSRLGVFVVAAVIAIVAAAQCVTDTTLDYFLLFALGAQLASCTVVYLLGRPQTQEVAKAESRSKPKTVIDAVLALCIAIGAFSLSYHHLTLSAVQCSAETVQDVVFQTTTSLEKAQSHGNTSDKLERIDDVFMTTSGTRADNWSWLTEQPSTACYNSMINGNLHRWFKRDNDISSFAVTPSFYRGFDNRYFLETAWGVTYKIGIDQFNQTNTNDMEPYGRFTAYKGSAGDTIYRNELNVGLDLWYESVLPESEYEAMDYAERDAALLQSVVVPDAIAERYPISELDDVTDTTALSLNDATLVDCHLNADSVLIAEDGCTITFPFEQRGNTQNGEWLFSCIVTPLDDQEFTLIVNKKGQQKMPSTYPWSYPLYEYSFSLPGDTEELTLQFTPGRYKLENIRLAYNSYEKVDEWVAARNAENLEDISIEGDTITGDIKCTQNGIMVLNIPYSKGWSCSVDDTPTELFPANGVFTGFELSAGDHIVSLIYAPPHWKIGLLLTLGTCCALIIYTGIKRFSKRRMKSPHEDTSKARGKNHF